MAGAVRTPSLEQRPEGSEESCLIDTRGKGSKWKGPNSRKFKSNKEGQAGWNRVRETSVQNVLDKSATSLVVRMEQYWSLCNHFSCFLTGFPLLPQLICNHFLSSDGLFSAALTLFLPSIKAQCSISLLTCSLPILQPLLLISPQCWM